MIATLLIRNFKAKLPDGCVQVISVTTIPKEKLTKIITGTLNDYTIDGYKKNQVYDTFIQIPSEIEMKYKGISNEITHRSYCIKSNEILFMGNYSSFFLFKWVQKLKEYILPEKVIVKYQALL